MSTITPEILLRAYAAGIFPMAEDANDNALYWVEPEERGIIPLKGLNISRSLRKAVRRQTFEIRIDTAFQQVMLACAEPTEARPTTWINKRILNLYTQLHELGYGHSVECWHEGQLVGGLYGLKIGGAFFGESMFARATDASKVALVHLVARLNAGNFQLLDAQFMNPHLERLGALPVPQEAYQQMLALALDYQANFFPIGFSDRHPEMVLQFANGDKPNLSDALAS